MQVLTLTSDDCVLEIAPELGGAILRFDFERSPVLRPAPRNPTNMFETASFAMAPYANRVAYGAFEFAGRHVEIGASAEAPPHALHGVCWRLPWRVDDATEVRAVISVDYSGGPHWPWPFVARQEFSIDGNALSNSITIANTGDQKMPLSFGFHPYFERSPDMALRARTEGRWLTDETMLPLRRALTPSSLAEGEVFDQTEFLDYCYYGWNRSLEIFHPGRAQLVSLSASPNCAYLHLYNPPHEDYFCAEPVSAMPDAFNRRDAYGAFDVLSPGESQRAEMQIGVRRAHDWRAGS